MRRPRTWAEWWLSGAGIGYLPGAPATWGSLLGLGLLVGSGWLPVGLGLLTWGIALAVSQKAFRQAAPSQPDPPWIVADEILALWLVGFLTPPATPVHVVEAFFWFRFWDITKLWPAVVAEKVPGFWGILADDLVAAMYTVLCLWLMQ